MEGHIQSIQDKYPGFPRRFYFRPSAAEQWLSCFGAVWVSTIFYLIAKKAKAAKKPKPPGTTSSVYAREGTTGHAYLSHFLTGEPVSSYLKKDEEPFPLTDDDIEKIRNIADCIRVFATSLGAQIYVEIKRSVVIGDHEIPGKADVVLVAETEIVVLDYKHGAGIRVYAQANPQLTLYGLMALALWPGRALTIGIIQPRGVGKGIDTWPCSESYLEAFRGAAEAAIEKAYDMNPSFNPGPWCRTCKGQALGACPAKLMDCLRFGVGLSTIFDKLKNEKDPPKGRPPLGLEPEDLPVAWWLLHFDKTAEKISKSVYSESLEYAKRGGRVPGWHLERKPGRRFWKEPESIASVLAVLTGKNEEDFLHPAKPRAPIALTDVEKMPEIKAIAAMGDKKKSPLDPYISRGNSERLALDGESLELLGVLDDVDMEE